MWQNFNKHQSVHSTPKKTRNDTSNLSKHVLQLLHHPPCRHGLLAQAVGPRQHHGGGAHGPPGQQAGGLGYSRIGGHKGKTKLLVQFRIQQMYLTLQCYFFLSSQLSPTSGRAVQQKVEVGSIMAWTSFFDWRHPQRWGNLALLDAAAASMTGCAQSTFTSLNPTSCGAMLHGCLPTMFFLDPGPLNMLEVPLHKPRQGLCILAWVPVADIVLQLRTLQDLEPGRACKQAGPALRNFAGEHSHRLHPVLPFFERLLWRGIWNMGPYALLAAGWKGPVQLCDGLRISFCVCKQQGATTTHELAHDLASPVLSPVMYSKWQALQYIGIYFGFDGALSRGTFLADCASSVCNMCSDCGKWRRLSLQLTLSATRGSLTHGSRAGANSPVSLQVFDSLVWRHFCAQRLGSAQQ